MITWSFQLSGNFENEGNGYKTENTLLHNLEYGIKSFDHSEELLVDNYQLKLLIITLRTLRSGTVLEMNWPC